MIKQYKFLRTGNKSEHGNHEWILNKWYKAEGKLELCENGFHSSEEPYDAFSFVQGEILAVVECKGEHLKDNNEYCWREQRVVKTYKWTKKDSLKLAIFSAELCLKNFEDKYPNDLRPREAIEAAKKVLLKDTKENRDIAEAAAHSAYLPAEYAYWSAYWSAKTAYQSAESAESAESEYMSAEYAYWSAESALWSAYWSTQSAYWSVKSNALKKIQTYFKKIVKEKKNER